jgi:tRNA A37 methylthiotransferase MiaB
MDSVPEHVARFRGRQLRRLIARKNLEFRSAFVGKTLDVLVFDEAPASGYRAGLSDNFVKVSCPEALQAGRWHRLRIQGAQKDGWTATAPGTRQPIASQT